MNPQTIAIVKSTVPALQAHGEAITSHFYKIMFEGHPQVKAFFNEAHQAAGTQARALAGAVIAYGAHIDRLEAIAGALPRIIQKHAALGVLPEHYPVVGHYLLRAVKEVLGDAATDEVIAAWGEAYESLAGLLIAAEEAVYSANAAQPGGWRGTREFRVARREDESEVITSFYLEPVDGGALLAFSPGQYLTLVLEIDGQPVRRNYSLSDAPGKPWYRISVKKEEGGRASNWLHEAAAVGTRLQVQAPCGDFVLQPAGELARPLVLVTGGVGITPAMSMLESVAHTGRPVHFVHAARHGGAHAFRARVDALAQRHANVKPLYVYDAPRESDTPHATGFVTRELLAGLLPEDRDVDLYFLGPKPFMQAVYANGLALGVPKQQLRYEFFGPLEALEA
ncbi:NO-inducible flavohemoprotein [Variovorax boronicumulans]|uniref:NO-inducible flavohemoprotein n=1 Tax=Variovorax boronicumulans TaxID=436515 RepID=UPI00085C2E6E|nr:NO-inducible flavohemoprotein [Variovorax boronicumulans]OEZ31859.1 dihydropteridine reductase [Variovorax boronicumulans]